jgi:hypothetical protein
VIDALVRDHHPHVVALARRQLVDVGLENGGQAVPGDDVRVPVHEEGRPLGELVQEPLQLQSDGLGLTLRWRAPFGLLRKPPDVLRLIRREAQGLDEGLQDGFGRRQPSLLDAVVVVVADRHVVGDLFAPQADDATGGRLTGGQPRATRTYSDAPINPLADDSFEDEPLEDESSDRWELPPGPSSTSRRSRVLPADVRFRQRADVATSEAGSPRGCRP